MQNPKTDPLLRGAIVLLSAVLVYFIYSGIHERVVVAGDTAPDFTITADNGQTVSLSDFKGKLLVLNFWASWCPPCRQEAPVLQAAARRTAGQVAFVGVDIQDSDAGARAYEAEMRDPYPIGPATLGGAADYGVNSPPETFFIDRSGTVLNYVIGPLDKSTLDRYLGMISG